MCALDILFYLVFLVGFWKGYSNGLLKEVLGLIGVFIGIYVAHLFYEQVGSQLAPTIGTSIGIANIIAFALIWLGFPILLGFLSSLLTKVAEMMGLEEINSLGGVIVSLAKYAIILGLLCNVISITQILDEKTQQESVLFKPLQQATSKAFGLAKEQWEHISANNHGERE